MKTEELFEEKVSIKNLETTPRIKKEAMIGWFAVVQGSKIWKSNLLTADEARNVIKTYDTTLPDHPSLRVVFITK